TTGHLAGLKSLKKVVAGAIKCNVKYLSLYCFSTENWKRSAEEVSYLMSLFSSKIYGELPFYNEHGIKILTIGDLSPLPEEAKKAISETIEATKNNSVITLQLAINYGGQSEICQAVNRAIEDGVTQFDPETLRQYFEHPEIPPVDVIARSAGEIRLSNFLLYDSAYAEFVFCDKLWPDWNEEDVASVLEEYSHRVRRFGGVK
ncbi:MAG: polyprenyl diphosphate synthase, partial [Bullifex sp.]